MDYAIWLQQLDRPDGTRNRRSKERGQATEGQGILSRALHRLAFAADERAWPSHWFFFVIFSYVYKSILTFSAIARLLVSPGLSMFSKLIHP